MIISTAFAATEGHVAEHNMFQDPTFWVGVAFCITVIALVKLCGKAISSYLQSRGDKIASQIDEASSLRKQAEQLLAEYREKQANMKQTTEAALKEAEEKAQTLKANIQSDFEQKLQNREALALQRLEQATKEASEEIRSTAISLSMRTVEQILSEKLKTQDGQRLIDEAIDSLPELFKEHRI